MSTPVPSLVLYRILRRSLLRELQGLRAAGIPLPNSTRAVQQHLAYVRAISKEVRS